MLPLSINPSTHLRLHAFILVWSAVKYYNKTKESRAARANRDRLESLEAFIEQREDRDFLFLNISQNPDFATISSSMPRLITSSQIWSVQRQAVLTPFELLNVQCWPMHMPVDELPVHVLEVVKAVQQITWAGLTKIAGNGMNTLMFGHVLGVAALGVAASQAAGSSSR